MDGRFRYIALLDLDEVILPLQHSTWGEMLRAVRVEGGSPSPHSWNFRQVRSLFQCGQM